MVIYTTLECRGNHCCPLAGYFIGRRIPIRKSSDPYGKHKGNKDLPVQKLFPAVRDLRPSNKTVIHIGTRFLDTYIFYCITQTFQPPKRLLCCNRPPGRASGRMEEPPFAVFFLHGNNLLCPPRIFMHEISPPQAACCLHAQTVFIQYRFYGNMQRLMPEATIPR